MKAKHDHSCSSYSGWWWWWWCGRGLRAQLWINVSTWLLIWSMTTFKIKLHLLILLCFVFCTELVLGLLSLFIFINYIKIHINIFKYLYVNTYFVYIFYLNIFVYNYFYTIFIKCIHINSYINIYFILYQFSRTLDFYLIVYIVWFILYLINFGESDHEIILYLIVVTLP